MCRLLRVIYVVNDLVFSSNPTGDSFTNSMICGLSDSHQPLSHISALDEIIIENDIGKVFNRHTKLIYSGCETGIDLRTQLWWFLRTELLALKIDYRNVAGKKISYYITAKCNTAHHIISQFITIFLFFSTFFHLLI